MLRDTDIEKLIILIDDLDRCSPEWVIENLEAIKLFLSVSGTAFIIGADPRVVEHAIRLRYAERAIAEDKKDESERLVKDYLEKVIQIPYRLGKVSGNCFHFIAAFRQSDQFLPLRAGDGPADIRNQSH